MYLIAENINKTRNIRHTQVNLIKIIRDSAIKRKRIDQADQVDQRSRTVGIVSLSWNDLGRRLLLFPVIQTGKNHGTKFIHTIIWCPRKAERKQQTRS